MKDYRDKTRNGDWSITATTQKDGTVTISPSDAQLAVLMDIREELQTLNRLLGCGNFIGIPATLKTIARNTAKPKA